MRDKLKKVFRACGYVNIWMIICVMIVVTLLCVYTAVPESRTAIMVATIFIAAYTCTNGICDWVKGDDDDDDDDFFWDDLNY